MKVTYIIMIADHIPQCNTVEERIGHEEVLIIHSSIMSWVDNSSAQHDDSKESPLKALYLALSCRKPVHYQLILLSWGRLVTQRSKSSEIYNQK